MHLGELASVRSGLVLARKESREPTPYCYNLLTLRSIHPDGSIAQEDLSVFHASEPLKAEYLTQPGDIIVRLTTPYTAILIDSTTTGLIVSSNFMIIRMESNALLPDYLFWLLNTPAVKRRIYTSTTSNVLSAVKASFFTQFQFHVPPISQQERIGQIHKLARRETALLHQLAEEKEKYYAHAPRCDIQAVPDAAGHRPGFHANPPPGRAAGHLRPQHAEAGIRLVR